MLDDYQDAFSQIVDVEKYRGKISFKIFNESFVNENEAIVSLEQFGNICNERKNSNDKNLLENLPKLKYIMTSGMRNNSINLEIIEKGIIVCGTEINSNPG